MVEVELGAEAVRVSKGEVEVGWCDRVELRHFLRFLRCTSALFTKSVALRNEVLTRPLSEAHSVTSLLDRVRLVRSVPFSSLALR